MVLIDSHAHLYLEEFKEDRQEMMERAEKAGIGKIFLPNIDSTSVDAMLAIERKYPLNCFAMMGLHPCSVMETWKDEMDIVESWLSKRKFTAVGEMGIDLFWDKAIQGPIPGRNYFIW